MPIKIRVATVLIKDAEILLVNHRRLGRSYWVLPGGALEMGEPLEKCALREVQEETNLKIKVDKLLYVIETISPSASKHNLDIIFLGEITGGELRANSTSIIEQPGFVRVDSLKTLEFYPPIADTLTVDIKKGFKGTPKHIVSHWVSHPKAIQP
jgi:8-oxo-dGTP diphosphatase